MDFSSEILLLKQLTFNEAFILTENVVSRMTHGGLIARLDFLLKTTKDERLSLEIQNLLMKVKDLSPTEYETLKQDILSKKILFPPNYTF